MKKKYAPLFSANDFFATEIVRKKRYNVKMVADLAWVKISYNCRKVNHQETFRCGSGKHFADEFCDMPSALAFFQILCTEEKIKRKVRRLYMPPTLESSRDVTKTFKKDEKFRGCRESCV